MIAIEHECVDWLAIRQSLALSILTGKGVEVVEGRSFLNNHPEYQPLMGDIAEIVKENHWGALTFSSDNIVFIPGSTDYGNYELATGPYSSASELIMLLLPSLISMSFRSSIKVSGVTHSSISYPTSFINDTLFALLENIGIYSSISLKRFGFYGSGGGSIESKIYPLEEPGGASIDAVLLPERPPEIIGGRVYISGMSMEIANREKAMLSSHLGIDDKRISVIEVRNSAGMGNVMQLSVQFDILPVVFSRVIDAYNYRGDFIFADRDIDAEVDSFLDEVRIFLWERRLTERIVRELVPFLWIVGIDVDVYGSYHEGLRETIALAERFLGDFNI
jgi:RNA 3'-terminal phosphate cyclase (ATP)